MTDTYQIVYWRDIPAQVKVRSGRQRIARPLSPRFQEAIDEAAMRAGMTNTDAYLNEWHASEWQPFEGDPEVLVENLVADLEAGYPPERLQTLIASKGIGE